MPVFNGTYNMDREALHTTAHMARLHLSEGELESFGAAVLRMLEYFAKMEELDVRALEPTTHVLLKQNRLRADDPSAETDPDRLLRNAPELEDRLITIPNVL